VLLVFNAKLIMNVQDNFCIVKHCACIFVVPYNPCMPPAGAKSKPYVFRPPRHVPLAMALARGFVRLYLRHELGVHKVILEPGTKELLESLRGQRVVLTPNHPSYEPPVVFHLSGMLRMNFYWLAAREVFEVPLQGALVSRIGAYSIDRGAQDSSALNATRRLIAEGRNWLVLFPEGQEHYLHDLVLPFLPGAARLGFGAIEDLLTGNEAPLPSVQLLPLALRYYYLKDMRSEIETMLRRLESRLGLASPTSGGQ
jgi:1-acyl-sn-glycerol-3-phosphate acyltransferase